MVDFSKLREERAKQHLGDLYHNILDEYDVTKQNMKQLLTSGFLNQQEYDGALIRLEEAFQRVVTRIENYTPMAKLPVAPLPPMINRHEVRGIVAFRQWNWDASSFGKLSPLFFGQKESWRPVMYADQKPDKSNQNGLYARSLSPSGADTDNFVYRAGRLKEVFGFVELTGHIEEHTDGVLRAERAKILSLYIPVGDETTHSIMSTGLLDRFKDSYYPVPVYPVTSYQATLIIMREVLINCQVQMY